jgi:hypothetical protein
MKVIFMPPEKRERLTTLLLAVSFTDQATSSTVGGKVMIGAMVFT